MAGVLAAENDAGGVVGIAPGVQEDVWWCKLGPNTEIADCINELSGNVRIINMSYGSTGFSQDVSNAVANAWDDGEGDLLISIANNRDSTSTPPTNMYPAEHSAVIGVSGVNPYDSTFMSGPAGLCPEQPYDSIFDEWGNASNYGDYVELSAPFYTLSTAASGGSYEYGAVCGTSFAAPHVAGVAALIWQKNPSWSAAEVRDRLTSTAKDLGAAGRDDYFGYGLVDAYSALSTPPAVAIQGPSLVISAGTKSWSANASGGTGSDLYTWDFREAGGSWFEVSSQQSYQTYVNQSDAPYFDLRVTVTSGGESSDTHRVNVNIGGGGCPPFCE